jgi:hypothetical protein
MGEDRARMRAPRRFGARWTVTLLFAVAASTASAATAQDTAHSFTELAPMVTSGTRIRISYGVTATTGTAEGTLTGLSDHTLTIVTRSGRALSFPETDVRRVDRRRAFTPWATGIGAGIGAVVLWLYAYRTRDCDVCDYHPGGALMVGGGIGAAIGLPFDLFGTSRQIYERPRRSVTLMISPHVAPRSQSIVATIRF